MKDDSIINEKNEHNNFEGCCESLRLKEPI